MKAKPVCYMRGLVHVDGNGVGTYEVELESGERIRLFHKELKKYRVLDKEDSD